MTQKLHVTSKIKDAFLNIIDFITFIFLLIKNRVFSSRSQLNILLAICTYVQVKHKYYNKQLRIMSRTPVESYKLLCSLCKSYTETKSLTTLNQIAEVLKEEVIDRK